MPEKLHRQLKIKPMETPSTLQAHFTLWKEKHLESHPLSD